MKRLLILALLSFSLIACSLEETDPTKDWSAARFYHEAKTAMDLANFDTAIEYLESLESRFPFGKFATQAQLDVIYAYYRYDEPESAIASADRFIKLNPKHPNVDYAYYIKGLVNFDRGGTILDKISTRDISQFDPSTMNKSYQDLSTLITLFPDSRYVPDVKQRLIYLRNQMAKSELNIAKFYQSRKAWAAAANRVKLILSKFQGSDVIKEALEVQLDAYQHLGFDELANDVKRIIDLNYGTQAS